MRHQGTEYPVVAKKSVKADGAKGVHVVNSCRHLHEPKTRFLVGRLVPFRGGSFTRWKRRVYPGAPKKPLMSRSQTQLYAQHICLARPTASSADFFGRYP